MRGRPPLLRNGLHIGFALSIVLAAILASSEVQAHEQRQVGEYTFTVGFLTEPAIVEEPNGLDLRVARGEGDAAMPVEGLANTLQAEVSFGGESMALELEPAFGQPGAYQAHFIPTAEGAYTFHITGTIEGTNVDESFTSGPETFAEVSGRESMSFPEDVAPVGQVADEASDASSAASTALIVAIVGVVVGVAGIIVGVIAFMTARRRSPAAASSRPVRESED